MSSVSSETRFLRYLWCHISTSSQHEKYCNTTTPDHLHCEGILPAGNFPGVTGLNVTHIDLKKLDLTYLQKSFPDLRNLTIIGSNLTQLRKIVMPHKPLMDLEVLHLSCLQISSFCDNFTSYFPNLKVLNISGNFIGEFPFKWHSHPSLKAVYLSGNRWNCSESLEWILTLNQTIFKDLKELICFKMPHNNKPLVAIAEFRKITRETCTPNCSCLLIKCVTTIKTDILEPIIEVNCSYRGFTELPSTFPPKTKTLHLEGNFIKDLGPLRTNLIYRDLWDLFLDNNLISNVHILESSFWLTHFRTFSLRNNQISELPVYAIDNALQHNGNMPNAVRLYLGGNPWRCDCVFAPRLKEMLQKYAPQVIDRQEVKCSEKSENGLVPLIDLSRSSVCHSPSEYTIQEALDLLNGVLALLIVLVLGKLAYDYYHFKKTGRLPWIVTKLP